MPTDLVSWMMLIARLLLGGAFVFAGLRNLTQLPRLTGLMSARGIPMAAQLTLFGVIFQLVCGALMVIDLWTPWAALGEAAFVIVAALLVHPFWVFPKGERGPHIAACTVNTAL